MNNTTHNTMTRGKSAYLAGVIDSDGSISVIKSYLQRKENRCPRFVLEITVTNTSKEMMDWIVENFGGTYSKRKYRENPSKIGNRIIYQRRITYGWKATSKTALKVLREIEEYLVAKKHQAKLAIKFQENLFKRKMISVKAGNGLSHYLAPEEVERRTQISEMIANLNKGIQIPATTKRSGTLEKG